MLETLAQSFDKKRGFDKNTLRKIINYLSLQINPGDKVLDLGCGSGRLLIPLAYSIPKSLFTGFDKSHTMLNTAKKKKDELKLKNIKLIKGNFNNKSWIKTFSEDIFNCVIIFQAIHFAKNP